MTVGATGAVAPVHKYTSYEVAPDAVFHVSVAVVVVAMVDPFAGAVLVTQTGAVGMVAVVKVVAFVLQPVDAPTAFFGTMYQLYSADKVNAVAL